MGMAFGFLFMIASALVMFAVGWCWLCFKIGCWMMRGFRGRSHSVHAAFPPRPEPVVIQPRVMTPHPPLHVARDPRWERSSRRRHGGGAAVVMTVLAIGLVVFCAKTFSRSSTVQRERARAARTQRDLERRIGEFQVRAKQSQKDLKRQVEDAKQRALALLTTEKTETAAELEVLAPVPLKEGSWNVTGFGQTVADADRDALEKAYVLVAEQFRQRYRGFEWPISLEFIHDRLVKDSKTSPIFDDKSGETMQERSLLVEITPEDQRQVLEIDRRYRMEHRMIWLGQILAAVVVLLATGAAYIRLDEASKGYYTHWLRLVALAIVASAGMSLWYFA